MKYKVLLRALLPLAAVALLATSCPDELVPVTGVTLDKSTATMEVGDNLALVATVAPSDATVKVVSWASSNEAVASVDASGNVTAVSAGGAKITVTTLDGGFTASCTITVKEPVIPVTSVELDQHTLTLTEGETAALVYTVKPDNASDKTVTWASSDEAVATVDYFGNVIAVAPGTADITVTTVDGGKTDVCAVTVLKAVIAVQSVKIVPLAPIMTEGETLLLEAVITPDDADDKSVTWSSSNPSVATVDAAGLLTAVAPGAADITVTTTDGGKTFTTSVTVNAKIIKVENVMVAPTSLTLTEGETFVLAGEVNPSNATDKSVSWSTSNSSVATVDASGKVTAVSAGTATITVTSHDGGFTATCAVTVNKKIIHVASVELDKTTLNMPVGTTDQLTATVKPADATDKSVTWASTNTGIATVDAAGKVTAVSAGAVTITVTTTDGGKMAGCDVTVYVPVVPVTSITLDKSSETLEKGQTLTLVATVKPDDATNKTVTWSSSDNSVATVDNTGKVTAVGGGSATITAKAGEFTATCVIKVNVPVSGVALNKTELALAVGASETLIATVQPADATDNSVTWASDNTSVATVDADGKVTAVAAGAANITVTTTDGGKTATCAVTVSVPTVAVTGVTLDKTSETLILGQSLTLTATVSPTDATNKNVTWTSDNPAVATVNAYGIVITNSEGTATITATTVDGGKTATCVVTVVKPVVKVESVTLDQTSLALAVGGTATLAATVLPADAADKSVTWSSDKPSVATVDGSGKVTAVAEGTAVITVTTTDGGFTATCTVTVSNTVVHVTSVSLNKTELEMTEGDTETLVATVKPDNATDKSVTWESSETKVATVDANGKVTAVSAGVSGNGSIGPNEAIITVKTVDGGWSASCKVIVKMKTVAVTSVSLNKSEITLEVGFAEQLIATVLPENATNKNVTWESGNTSIARVYPDGKVEGHGPGEATVTVKTVDGGKTATCKVTVNAPATAQVEAIDLGLSVKWANMNVGASAPEGYGDYYTWGDIETHYYPGYAEQYTSTSAMWKPDTKGYKWSNCKWGYHWSYTEGSFTKYNTDKDLGIVDNKTRLDPEDDVARVVLGGDWRMPTYAEVLELTETYFDKSGNYKWEWSELNGVEGIKLTYKVNNNTIFFPTTGRRDGFYLNYAGKYTDAGHGSGLYWTSDLAKDYNSVSEPWDPYGGMVLEVGCSTSSGQIATPSRISRFFGNPVRAVTGAAVTPPSGGSDGKENGHEYVDLGLPSGTKWATCNVGASELEGSGDYFAWGETDPHYTGNLAAGTAVWKSGFADGGYTWPVYKWGENYDKLTKYNTSVVYGSAPDGKKVLETADDAASVNWGGKWRMPTWNDWKELAGYCSSTWTSNNGVKGIKFTSKSNGKSIFIPAAGSYGYGEFIEVNQKGTYWTSSVYPDMPFWALLMNFSSSGAVTNNSDCTQSRYQGQPVRAVFK